jgi:flagellar hook protein FlgE
MQLESALYSGREGLISHGQAIAVVSDNVSNTNTVGYKASRVEFSDLLSEGRSGDRSTTQPASGSGATLSHVRQLFEGGVIEATGRNLDVGIDGGGFFMVGDVANPFLSRAGNFAINQDGYLVSSDGYTVLGLAPGATTLSSLNMYNVNTAGAVTSKSTLIGNLDATLNVTAPPTNPQTFAAINESASYMASGNVYDSLGQRHDVTIAFFKTANNTWTAQAYVDGGEVGQTAGVPVQIGQNATLNYSANGVIETANKAAAAITATPAWSNGAAAGNFSIDVSGFSQFSAASTLSNISQDGKSVGNVEGYEIKPDGQIIARMDTGSTTLVGTIQLANVTNKDGLERVGSAMFRVDKSAGTKTTSNPGVGSFGKLQGGALERSTVDISIEFVNIVMLQRGYQASSQALNTASTLLKDTLGLIR